MNQTTKSLLTFAIAAVLSIQASEAQLAPNAPRDQPGPVEQRRAAEFEAAIAPYIAKARSTYPDAKARFLRGLPKGQGFYVTTRLRDESGRYEQTFIRVLTVADGKVSGAIASQIQFISGYRAGQSYSFPETDLIDWTISKPDGSEEGNFVGKFLDTYRP